MDNDKYQIEISQVDADLGNIDNQIEEHQSIIVALEKEKDFLLRLKNYIKSKQPANEVEVEDLSYINEYGGVSEFIFKLLATGEKHSGDIVKAFATATGKAYDEVSNNISNAINRLKNAKDSKVVGREDPRGRRYGSYLRLKTEEELMME